MTTQQFIVVGNNGWVFIGDAPQDHDFSKGTSLVNAGVIRKWGTERGLGQLALEGVQRETVIDPCGTVIVPGTPVAVMPCVASIKVC